MNKKYSWLTPKGKFLPVKTRHDMDFIRMNGGVKISMGDIYKKGYQRINCVGKDLFVSNSSIRPNRIQLQELINLAIEENLDKITFDDDVDDIVLWSKHDMLEHKKVKKQVIEQFIDSCIMESLRKN